MNNLIEEILEDIELTIGRKQVLASIARDTIIRYAPKIWRSAKKWKDTITKPDKGKVVCLLLPSLGPTLGYWDGDSWRECEDKRIIYPTHWIELPE